MSIEISFNELSLIDKAPTIDEALNKLQSFVLTLLETQKRLRTSTFSFRSPSAIISAEVAPNYSVGKWLKDSRVDREQITYLLTLLTNQPYLDFLSGDDYELNLTMEVKYQTIPAKGLAFAYRRNGLSISMPFSNTWDTPFLEVDVIELSEDCETTNYSANVRHASTIDNLDSHSDWFDQNRNTQVSDGLSLEILFPELSFLGNSRTQLIGLGKGDPKTKSLFRSLSSIKNYLDTWQEGPLDIRELKNHGLTTIRTDGEATLEKFGEERTYTDPYGMEKIFKWHFDIAPGEWRGYIAWNDNDRKIWLTYIGPHLSTKKFN